jgi:putative aldouronate transport system permease protein
MRRARRYDPFRNPLFHLLNGAFLVLVFIVIIFPLAHVVSMSLSSPDAVSRGLVWFVPVQFSLKAYAAIIENESILRGFYNSFIYALFGTLVNITVTVMAAYPLSKKLYGKGVVTGIFLVTMFFSGGLVPTYLVVRSLGMVNTRWAMIIPGALSVWLMVITRVYFQTQIPKELCDSAEVDGASHIGYLLRILLPLSRPIIAVLVLLYAVGHWNSYFNALIYLYDDKLFNLQLVLRNIIVSADMLRYMADTAGNLFQAYEVTKYLEVLKYSVIVFASLPVMILYPFIQKHFVKAIMLGSLKG